MKIMINLRISETLVSHNGDQLFTKIIFSTTIVLRHTVPQSTGISMITNRTWLSIEKHNS